jgi:LacI family transcriptional regulator, repressor for deo operon, udp, cdd, tsx, nupC, and nupG
LFVSATISDVASAAGVSKGAVSLALNGQPGVGEETRERILAAAKALGWTPSLRAKGLASARAYAIGLVLARDPQLLGTDPFFAGFIAGIESVLAEHEYTLVLTVASGSEAETKSYRKLAAGRVDGVILTDVLVDDPRIALLQELKLRAITLNRPEIPSPFPAVSMNGTIGFGKAVEHLVALGHTRIAHVGGPQRYVHGSGRRRAWEEALQAAGLRTNLFLESDFTAQGGAVCTEQLLSATDRPTAIVYANDLMAMAGQSVAQGRGFRIPEDLSITGYDDAEFVRYLNPPLTTISADPLMWGHQAAAALLAVLDGSHDGQDVVLSPPELIVRGSTSHAPK